MKRLLRSAVVTITAVGAPVLTIVAIAGSVLAGVLAAAAWILFAWALVQAPATWPESARPRETLFANAFLVFVLLAAGWIGTYAIAINHSLCGTGSGQWMAVVVGALTYVALASSVLARSPRVGWIWPFAIVPAWAVHLLLVFVLPGTHGFCET